MLAVTPYLLLMMALVGPAVFVSTLVHEVGHAIPAILFKKKPVTIFLGSYGDEIGSMRLRFGAFIIFIKYNPLRWGGGLCRYSGDELPTEGILLIWSRIYYVDE